MIEPMYDAGGITLYAGDMRAVLPRLDLPANAVVLTDPPYNAGKKYGKDTNDRRPWPEWCAWWDECLDVMLAAAPDVLAFLSQTAYRQYVRLGRHEMAWSAVWVKPLSMAVCAAPFMPHWEPICYWGPSRRRRGDGVGWGSDVLIHNVEFGRSRRGHPTPKPLALMRDLVSRFQGRTIIDPFAGSGTTLIAARQRGIRAIGVEIEPAYVAGIIAQLEQTERLMQWGTQPAMAVEVSA